MKNIPEVKLIVGLGNPGRDYENTRHNIGFQVVNKIAADVSANWKKWAGIAETAAIGQEHPVILLKPQEYMNNSGLAVRNILDYYHIKTHQILVVFDDFSIPLGTLRLRRSGSAGGHNGLSSIIEHIKTSDFPRLRLGIGPLPAHFDPANFVLAAFNRSEQEDVKLMIERAVETIDKIQNIGFDKTISQISNKAAKKQ